MVLFGESLPQEAWESAEKDIRDADLVIVIGSSLQVYPVNILPSLSKGRSVYINNEVVSPQKFDLVIKGKAEEALRVIDGLLT